MAVPNRPTDLRATGINGETEIYLTCVPPTINSDGSAVSVTEYVWYADYTELTRTAGPAATVDNPADNTTVVYRVKANNADGLSAFATRTYISHYGQFGSIDGFSYTYRPTDYAAKLASRSSYLKDYVVNTCGGVVQEGQGMVDTTKHYYPEQVVTGMVGMYLLTGDTDWYDLAIAQGNYVMNTAALHWLNGVPKRSTWQGPAFGPGQYSQPPAICVCSFLVAGALLNHQPFTDYARDVAVAMYENIAKGTMTIGGTTKRTLYWTWAWSDTGGPFTGCTNTVNYIVDFTCECGIAMVIGGVLAANQDMIDFGFEQLDLIVLMQHPNGGIPFWLPNGAPLPSNNLPEVDTVYASYMAMMLALADKVTAGSRYQAAVTKLATFVHNYLDMEPHTFTKPHDSATYNHVEISSDRGNYLPALAAAGYNYEADIRAYYSWYVASDGSEIDSNGDPVIDIYWANVPCSMANAIYIADAPVASFRAPAYSDGTTTTTTTAAGTTTAAPTTTTTAAPVATSLRLNPDPSGAGPVRIRSGRRTMTIGTGGSGPIRLMTPGVVVVLV